MRVGVFAAILLAGLVLLGIFGVFYALWILLYIPAILGDRWLAKRKAAKRGARHTPH